MNRTSSIWEWDVGNLGVGIVVRNTVVNTLIFLLESNYQMLKIDIHLFAVRKKQGSSKKTIVPVVTQVIVLDDGKKEN